ncbi:MAG: hypothetical protein U0R19_32260 [Bryobacteraceae bacterium]
MTFTQPLPSTTGNSVSSISKPSAASGNRWGRSYSIATPTVIGRPWMVCFWL